MRIKKENTKIVLSFYVFGGMDGKATFCIYRIDS